MSERLRPPDVRDPFTIAVLLVAGFVLGICAYLALHDPAVLCTPSIACPPPADRVRRQCQWGAPP